MPDSSQPPETPNDPTGLPPTEPMPATGDPGVPPTEAMPVVDPALPPTTAMAAGVPPTTPPPTDPNAAVPNGPDPRWYQKPGATAAIIAIGLIAIFLLVGWLLWWSDDDDDDAAQTTIGTAVIVDGSTVSTVDSTTIPPATVVEVAPASTVEVTLPPETTTTTTTTVPPTTVPATTAPTTEATTTVATTTSVPVVTVPPSPSATVMDIIAASPDLSRLNQLIVDAGLTDVLSGDDPITLFAPSNPAIETLEAAPGGAELLADPERLRELLLGHVVPGALDAATVFSNTELTTASGSVLPVDGAAQTVDGATLLVTDVTGANGVIQVVDRVLNVS